MTVCIAGVALNLTSIYMKAAHQVEDFIYRSERIKISQRASLC